MVAFYNVGYSGVRGKVDSIVSTFGIRFLVDRPINSCVEIRNAQICLSFKMAADYSEGCVVSR